SRPGRCIQPSGRKADRRDRKRRGLSPSRAQPSALPMPANRPLPTANLATPCTTTRYPSKGHQDDAPPGRMIVATEQNLNLPLNCGVSLIALGDFRLTHRRVEGTAVEQQVLADDKARRGTAEKRAGITEFGR